MVIELYCKKAAEEDFFVEYNVTENSFIMSLDAGLPRLQHETITLTESNLVKSKMTQTR